MRLIGGHGAGAVGRGREARDDAITPSTAVPPSAARGTPFGRDGKEALAEDPPALGLEDPNVGPEREPNKSSSGAPNIEEPCRVDGVDAIHSGQHGRLHHSPLHDKAQA
jgi:hypothetical protein